MKVTKNITIDLNDPRRHVVHLMENGNQREIVLTVLKDGMPFDVSEDIGAATLVKGVQYIRADGVSDYYETTSLNETAVSAVDNTTNQWTVLIDEYVTGVPGFAEIFVKFSLASGAVLYSFPITLDVVRTSAEPIEPGEPIHNSAAFLLKSQQATKTSAMTQRVGVDAIGRLWVPPGEGGGGSGGLQRTTITITQSGTTYSSDTPYSDIADAIENGDVVEAATPDGIARYEGIDGNNYIFSVNKDISDRVYIIRYGISTSNTVGRTAYAVDNSAIPQITTATITDSTYTILPVADFQYIFSNPVISLTISSSYAATGDWSIEFDAPTNVAPSVTIPSSLKTIPASPTFSANKHYEINCHNGYAVVAEW